MKVGKREKDSTSRICLYFLRSPTENFSLHLVGQKWVMWLLLAARKLAKEYLTFKLLERKERRSRVLGGAVGLTTVSATKGGESPFRNREQMCKSLEL